MDEPTILRPESHPDAVEVPVGDLESVTVTRGELAKQYERGKAASWAESRKHFASKSERARDMRADLDATTAKLEKLATLVSEALGVLIPGLAAPVQDSKKEKI